MKTKLTGIERASRVFLAVLAGLLIWGSAVNTEIFSVETRLPVAVAVSEGHTLLSMSLESLTVRYTGSGWEMLTFQLQGMPSAFHAEYQIEPGTAFPAVVGIPISSTSVEPEGQVAIERITPSQITCTIDTIISRNVPAAPVFTDGIPGRFRFTVVEPGFITVSGPASLVTLIDSVYTEPIQPESPPYFSSLAPSGEMVAYSSDSVRVSVFDPVTPSSISAVLTEGLLTP